MFKQRSSSVSKISVFFFQSNHVCSLFILDGSFSTLYQEGKGKGQSVGLVNINTCLLGLMDLDS